MLFLTNELDLPSTSVRLQVVKICSALLELSLMVPSEKYFSVHAVYFTSDIAACSCTAATPCFWWLLVLMSSLCKLHI